MRFNNSLILSVSIVCWKRKLILLRESERGRKKKGLIQSANPLAIFPHAWPYWKECVSHFCAHSHHPIRRQTALYFIPTTYNKHRIPVLGTIISSLHDSWNCYRWVTVGKTFLPLFYGGVRLKTRCHFYMEWMSAKKKFFFYFIYFL